MATSLTEMNASKRSQSTPPVSDYRTSSSSDNLASLSRNSDLRHLLHQHHHDSGATGLLASAKDHITLQRYAVADLRASRPSDSVHSTSQQRSDSISYQRYETSSNRYDSDSRDMYNGSTNRHDSDTRRACNAGITRMDFQNRYQCYDVPHTALLDAMRLPWDEANLHLAEEVLLPGRLRIYEPKMPYERGPEDDEDFEEEIFIDSRFINADEVDMLEGDSGMTKRVEERRPDIENSEAA